MRIATSLLSTVILLVIYAPGALAFFEQFFHGGQQQQAQPAPFNFQAHHDQGER